MPKVVKPPKKLIEVVTDPLEWSVETNCNVCKGVFKFWAGDMTSLHLHQPESPYERVAVEYDEGFWIVRMCCPTGCRPCLLIRMPIDLGRRIFKDKTLDPASLETPEHMQ